MDTTMGMDTAMTMGTDTEERTTTMTMDTDMDMAAAVAMGRSTVTATHQETAPATGMALTTIMHTRMVMISPRGRTRTIMDRTAGTVTIIRTSSLQKWGI